LRKELAFGDFWEQKPRKEHLSPGPLPQRRKMEKKIRGASDTGERESIGKWGYGVLEPEGGVTDGEGVQLVAGGRVAGLAW